VLYLNGHRHDVKSIYPAEDLVLFDKPVAVNVIRIEGTRTG